MTLPLKELFTHVQTTMERDYGIRPGALYGYREKTFIGESKKYLFDSPHKHWNQPGVVPRGHSDRLPIAMRDGIASATRLVDILSMSMPNGDFVEKIVEGIGKIAEKGRHVTVRMLFGNVLGVTEFKIDNLLGYIARELRNWPATVEVYAGVICFKLAASWNHAKLIAVDGNWIMTGGHNLWSEIYLGEKEPIFDMTMCYDGPVAESGTLFANDLWKFVAKNPRTIQTYCHSLKPPYTQIGEEAPPAQSVQPAPGAGTMPSMWVNAPGWGVFPEPNSEKIIGSSMMIALIKGLQDATYCQLSQQNLASVAMTFLMEPPPHYEIVSAEGFTDKLITYRLAGAIPDQAHFYNQPLIDGLAAFLLKGSDQRLQLVMSPPGAARSYSKNEPRGAIFDMIGYSIRRRQPGITKERVVALLNERMAVRYPAFQEGRYPKWKDGGLMGNHAKFWMLDKKLFYVGSENLYPYTGYLSPLNVNHALQEFGIIAQADETVSEMVRGEYFNLQFEAGEKWPAQVSDLRWSGS